MEQPFYEQHYRDYNISKREFVLARESVAYGDYASLEDDLETAFSEFSPAPAQDGDYTAYIASVADFIARVWQIHPFAEGNTRTVAVFLQQLLHFHGFPQDCSEAFDRSSLQFRNALVRANYRNIPLGRRTRSDFLKRVHRLPHRRSPLPLPQPRHGRRRVVPLQGPHTSARGKPPTTWVNSGKGWWSTRLSDAPLQDYQLYDCQIISAFFGKTFLHLFTPICTVLHSFTLFYTILHCSIAERYFSTGSDKTSCSLTKALES